MDRKAVLLAVLLLAALFVARRSFSQARPHEIEQLLNDLASHRQPPKESEFVFARVRFTSHGPGRRNFPSWQTCIPDNASFGFRTCGWAHDYPLAEQHLLQVTDEATGVKTNRDSYVIVELGSDDVYKYPYGLFSEVGEMTMDDNEVVHMREWLNRGGFGVADDFDGDNLAWFQQQMQRVFPNRSFFKFTVDHPLFHTYYDIPTLETKPPYPQRGDPEYWGLLDDNGRLCFVLDANNDLGDFWEWIDEPEYDLAQSTQGLRFGIDYIIYALTH